jgi:hypothetical protein
MARSSKRQDAVCPPNPVLTIENETTLSLYNHADYEAFKLNPEEKWM